LYSELIKDYDKKNKELITELVDLRNFVVSLFSGLCTVTSNVSSEEREQLDSPANINGDNKSVEELIELPFDNVHSDLNYKFQFQFNLLSAVISNKNNKNTSINVNNMTSMISSIHSDDEEKSVRIVNKRKPMKQQSVENELNSTFTVDVSSESSSEESEDRSHEIRNHPKTNRTNLEKKIGHLKAELNEYKKIIETQSKFIDSFTNLKSLPINLEKMSSSSSASLSSSSTSSSETEQSQQIVKAKKRESSIKAESIIIDDEKRMISEQKLKLEQDQVKLRKTLEDLNKKVNYFFNSSNRILNGPI
jgi:hypothetical protein